MNANLDDFNRAYKPKTSILIFLLLVALAPSLHLIFDIIEGNSERLLPTSLIVMLCHIIIGFLVARHFYQMKEYHLKLAKYQSNPEEFLKKV